MEDSPLISRPAIEFVLNQKFKNWVGPVSFILSVLQHTGLSNTLHSSPGE